MALTTSRRPGRPFTYADLQQMPDDGNRYELSNGVLVVTPAPNTRHQDLTGLVVTFLNQHKPRSTRVLPDAELHIEPTMVKRADVQVVDEHLVGGQSVTGTPTLAVEILSPSTWLLDLTEKRQVYADARIPAYWVVDPEAQTVTVFELEDGDYVERAVIGRDETIEVSTPFALTLRGTDIFG